MQPIPIGMTLRDSHGLDARQVYEFIAAHAEDATAYAYRPRGIGAAALDFYLILGAVASVASIASLIWTAYDKWVASKQCSAGESPKIYIAVRRPDGTVIDISLGGDVLTREDFIQRFELLVGAAQDPEFRLTHESMMRDLVSSSSWVRVKPRD